MYTEEAVEEAAWAIARTVGKRTILLEQDWKMARAALEAADEVMKDYDDNEYVGRINLIVRND